MCRAAGTGASSSTSHVAGRHAPSVAHARRAPPTARCAAATSAPPARAVSSTGCAWRRCPAASTCSRRNREAPRALQECPRARLRRRSRWQTLRARRAAHRSGSPHRQAREPHPRDRAASRGGRPHLGGALFATLRGARGCCGAKPSGCARHPEPRGARSRARSHLARDGRGARRFHPERASVRHRRKDARPRRTLSRERPAAFRSRQRSRVALRDGRTHRANTEAAALWHLAHRARCGRRADCARAIRRRGSAHQRGRTTGLPRVHLTAVSPQARRGAPGARRGSPRPRLPVRRAKTARDPRDRRATRRSEAPAAAGIGPRDDTTHGPNACGSPRER